MASKHTYRTHVADYPPEKLKSRVSSLVQFADWGDPLQCAVVLMASSGLRAGEVLALDWSEIDLDAGTAEITRSLTAAGMRLAKVSRTAKLSPESVGALRCLAAAARCGKGPRPQDPVIQSGGKRIQSRELSQWWYTKRGEFCMSFWTLADLRSAYLALSAYGAEAGR